MGESSAESLKTYEDQLKQVEEALAVSEEQSERSSLISLANDLRELISLTKDTVNHSDLSNSSTSSNSNNVDSEFALFMSEMEKEGVASKVAPDEVVSLTEEIKALGGSKCRAPHKHQWGDVVYHNAMICSVSDATDFEVKVLFTNPTHLEMLPCPYFLNMGCRFSDEKCKFSHGETVSFASLQEYVEPKFETLTIGSRVLAKKPDNLWYRAIVKTMDEGKCTVNFESNKKDAELQLQDVLPLEDGVVSSDFDESENDSFVAREDVINLSLMNTPSQQALGDWEKHTKGIGSKLMQKMGYVIGTGLGPKADGRIEPVTAVVLPAGKSLDHCMELREKCGGDKNLFSAERKLKRLQKKQERKNQRIYERSKKRVDVFSMLNESLNKPKEQSSTCKKTHREEIKKETSRNLNVASLKVEEDMRKVERDMFKIKDSLTRHSDVRTQMNKNLRGQLANKQSELDALQAKALNIKNEQSNRSDKKKLTVF